MNQVAIQEPRAKSVLLDMSDRYGMMPDAFEQTLRATVVPNNCTKEQFAAFLLVAKEYKLNPLLKEIYAFPSKGGIQPIVGVDGWANLINSHPAFDGMDFEDHFEEGNLASITCKMYRKDRTHPITATEYLSECKRPTEPWQKWPRRMLRHKAMIQAARYAFSFAGIIDPDEAERFAGEFAQDVTPRAQIVPISQRIAQSNSATDAQRQPDRVETVADLQNGGSDASTAGESPATNSNSSQAVSPSAPTETDTPATSNPPAEVAGTQSELPEEASEGTGNGEDRSGDDSSSAAPAPSLPEGWQITYAAALRRAQKPDSLSKYATQYWAQYGGWANHKDGPNGPTAIAIYDVFQNNCGRKDIIEAQLRELL